MEKPEYVTLPIGAFVQIKKKCLKESHTHGTLNHDVVERNGYLWIVVEVIEDHDPAESNSREYLYRCKSIATGQLGRWFPSEVTVSRGASK